MEKASPSPNAVQKRHKAALFFLASSTVGIGYMTYPRLCQTAGVVNIIVISTITGLISLFYSSLILRSYLIHKAESYADLVRDVLGALHYYLILAFILGSLLFSTTAQITVISQMAEQIIDQKIIAKLPFPRVINIAFGVLAVGLSFSKLYKIRSLSYIGNAFSLYTGCVLVAQAAEHLYRTGDSASMKLVSFNRDNVKVINNCLFSYTSQVILVSVMRVLKDDSDYFHYSALLRSHYLAFFLYSLVGVSGYALLGDDTPSTIFLKAKGPGILGNMFMVGRFGLFLSLSVTLCLKVLSIQHMGWSLYSALRGAPEAKGPNPKFIRAGISVAAGVIVTVGSILASEDILLVIRIVCGLLSPYIIFVCPTLLASALRTKMGFGLVKLNVLRVASAVFTVVLLLSCIA